MVIPEMFNSVNPVNLLALVMLIGAVYQCYLRKPMRVRNKAEGIVAAEMIKRSKSVKFGVGTSDVTPEGAQDNYTLSVVNQEKDGDDDNNIGFLQITKRSGGIPKVNETSEEGEIIGPREYPVVVPLAYPEGKMYVIAENNKVFGAVIHRAKGEPVFK